MRWLGGGRRGGDAPRPRPTLCRSLALKGLLDHLAREGPKAVLDLGPAVGANVELLSALGCRIRVLDVYDTLTSGAVDGSPDDEPDLLPHFAENSLDAVLAWDVFDHLSARQVLSLQDRLAPACGHRGLMLALQSTGASVPAAPLRHRIVDAQTLACEGDPEPQHWAARRTQIELARLLPRFAVRQSFLLRHGVREYLLASGGGPEAPAAGRRGGERAWYRRR